MRKFTEPTIDSMQRERTQHARELFSTSLEPLPANDDILILNSKDFNQKTNSSNSNNNSMGNSNNNDNSNNNNDMAHNGKINALRWLPKSEKKIMLSTPFTLATACTDGRVCLWNIGKLVNIAKKGGNGNNNIAAVPYHRITTHSSVELIEFTHNGTELVCLNRVLSFLFLIILARNSKFCNIVTFVCNINFTVCDLCVLFLFDLI